MQGSFHALLRRIFRKISDEELTIDKQVVLGKQVFIIENGKEMRFSVHQIIPEKHYVSILSGNNMVDIFHNAIKIQI